jgi:protein tyrosine phosphatase type 4A
MPFNDGGAPPDEVVNKWLNLLEATYKEDAAQKETIGVHCVAGLGRAPVLVAIALIESGMNALEAVDFIRERRRGSINLKQLQYLKTYKVKLRKRTKSCIVM